jgi:hypothetical protein
MLRSAVPLLALRLERMASLAEAAGAAFGAWRALTGVRVEPAGGGGGDARLVLSFVDASLGAKADVSLGLARLLDPHPAPGARGAERRADSVDADTARTDEGLYCFACWADPTHARPPARPRAVRPGLDATVDIVAAPEGWRGPRSAGEARAALAPALGACAQAPAQALDELCQCACRLLQGGGVGAPRSPPAAPRA